MRASVFAAGAVAALAGPGSAFIRFPCASNIVEERADPIINPGKVSGHVHKIVGGNAFSFDMDFAKARTATCSSCPIKEDFSNYWTPKLYYHAQNGSFISVPTVGDSASDTKGGQTIYYLQRGPDISKLKAFPEGLRMVAGDPFRRSFTGGFAQEAINFACLGAGKDETNGFPNYNCPDGLRAQVFFPSCWDGENLDSADHTSHMSYPETGNYNGGTCPSSHPVQLISLFFEVLYDTNSFKDMWYGSSQPFVFAQGDPTGYGFHGDFLNGWDVPTLQNIVTHCTADSGTLEDCHYGTRFTNDEQNSCKVDALVDEEVRGLLPKLPGCNAVQNGPDRAKASTDCPVTSIASFATMNAKYYKDLRSTGWAFRGCGPDDLTTRTLDAKNSVYNGDMYDTMTIENCIEFCDADNYMYAGLENGNQCFCGNDVPTDRIPVASTAMCQTPCAGDSSEYCGGPLALSWYKRCTGACTNKAKRDIGEEGWVELDEFVAEKREVNWTARMVQPVKREFEARMMPPAVRRGVHVHEHAKKHMSRGVL
ncbi:WSC-domain-containing protein [Aulographum hederae CBS 113979]|uniref:WSC-domain-containing protein n=1 Tax=Aulographum hederae CBS 113979 TaxID=1176131 RepID=A0A6G1GQX3_9PEZI|nr:WSC-domain-containing protein [Aulographum hederae CBS 113979]